MDSRPVGNERGSFTLEAALLMPVVLVICIASVFLIQTLFDQARVQYFAEHAAQRTAHGWANNIQQADQLPFPLSGWIFPQERPIGLEAAVPESIQSEGTLYKSFFADSIEARMSGEIHAPQHVRSVLPNHVEAEARASAVDPAALIRKVDFARTFAQELLHRGTSRKQANSAYNRFFERKSPESFAKHREAKSYLQKLVSGQRIRLPVSSGIREIDAWISSGVAHQAYLTFRESQLIEQLEKDRELLKMGDPVKGVVWHFFRKKGQQGKVGPSPVFLRKLEEAGISAVIHG